MNTMTAPTGPRPADTQPQQWLLVPALFTALALLAGGLGYSSSYLPDAPFWLSVPYLIPLGMVAATWRRPRTRQQWTNRIVLGGLGCTAALFYAKAAEVVLIAIAIAVWLVQGD
ncbi:MULTISPECIES: hypothetical protein [unclassified Streptomyces]|uniref:hypothetical protein n=1 Tax=unclassified Streptomyces TaxID=2593676 RepID=UPI001BE74B5E|nr:MULTISPECIES: hypothetical protein [unclassified Streptomyces]MBT2403598.1 hypothetical protein [Streptomyces sp. ISL-21]MBT2458374.1 hypothetical protein [Streptomyces sp. ISL-86]MBT2609925.1 hypothetical protein [Streptomyces sp. ISL-87]